MSQAVAKLLEKAPKNVKQIVVYTDNEKVINGTTLSCVYPALTLS
jgi:hypothetical protein